ncbi:cytochrome [Novosphingobium sp. PC22D]|uniref:cytochrome P450 n=1 Tax=Novosphingobium sp. PC22D TaxID=1962403 RepID=UPI000BF207B3|nr:cytochrome P450 [Novosphingobium sp. PC22D]PEQ13625.1 cytochrome [Novosphingobium sp. PC22D]
MIEDTRQRLSARYDPFSRDVMNDPLPYYEALREEAPALYLEKYDTWVFSRFQDVIDVLTVGANAFIATDTTLPTPEILRRHNGGQVAELPLDPLPIGAMLGSPHFEVLRNAHIKPFRPRAVRELTDFVRDLAEARLAELLPLRRFDLTQAYGGRVSASVICHLLDMPLDRADEVLDLVNSLSRTDPESGGTDVPTIIGRCIDIMSEYIAKRRAAGADGSVPLIDGLLSLGYYGRALTDAEVATQLTCVFIGGVETVPKITAHGLKELHDAPDQLDAVRQDLAANVPVAVEEMIRFCAPAQWFARTAHRDVEVAGAKVRKGQRVMVLFGSAARDPAEYDQPDSFIWNRPIERVLSFGTGQHYCIGIHLARLELRILIETFLRRVERFSFDMDRAVRLPSSFQWGWNELPVVIEELRA